MTLFPMLDDPNPPVATAHTLTRVHTRARIIRRRRRIAAAAPAVLAVGVAGAVVPRLRGEAPVEVATVTATTLPPPSAFGPSTTALPFDDRGEIFELTTVPAGWELSQERVLQVPEVGQFERMMGYRRPNEVDPIDPNDPFDYFSVYRTEVPASQMDRVRADAEAEALRQTTPGGREVYVFEEGTTLNVVWFVSDTIWIAVNGHPDDRDEMIAVLDSLEYRPPSPSCFDGDAVRTELAACGPVDYEAP